MSSKILELKLVKKILPIAGIVGVVSDIASPLVEFSNALPFSGLIDLLAGLLALSTLATSGYWFSIGKKKLSPDEDSAIPEIITACVVATGVFCFLHIFISV